jgi:hypothetical protein
MRNKILEENRRKRKELRTKRELMPFAIRYTNSCRYMYGKFRRTRTYGEE